MRGSSVRADALTPALLGLLLGVAAQMQQAALWPPAAYAGLVALGLAGAAIGWRSAWMAARPAVRWAVLAGALAAASFAVTGWRATAYASQVLPAALEGRDIAVVGRVASLPQPGENGVRFRLAVDEARLGGAPVRIPPRLALSWYGGPAARADGGYDLLRPPAGIVAGDRWQFTVRLRAPHGNLNPHGFDYELWLWEQGVGATGYVRAGRGDPPPLRLGASGWHPVERLRQQVRDAILAQVPDRRAAGVVAALAVGDQQAIERADWDVFRATGVAHLMSISGLHVTLFAWGAALAIGWGWRRSARAMGWLPAQQAALVGGIALAAAYALFSGWGVPAQRTVWMLAAVGGLKLSGRRWPWPVTWLWAACVVLLLDPWAVLAAGFWLSFVAVGVLFATDPVAGQADSMRLRGRFALMLREQAVVTVALAPLSLLLFQQLSLVGLLANLAAIPWVTLVVTPLALAGALVAPLWQLAAWSVQGLGALLELLAAVPGATLNVPAAPLWAGAAGLVGGLLLAMRLPLPLRALGLPLLLPVLLWQPARPAPGQFELVAADIGQGNAVIVRTARHTLVYDAGPRYSSESDAGHRVLVPLLRALGDRPDLLVVSHRDNDHAGGAAAVLAAHPGTRLLSSVETTHELAVLRAPLERCVAGQAWAWDGVRFEVLHPQRADYDDARLKPNALSCVLRVEASGRAALLAGDIEAPQEERLARLPGAALRADLLLVPHHGSRTSSSPALLAAVQPGIALVQAGYRNRFGHPHPAVTQRYAAAGVRLVASPGCGAAWWTSTEPAALHCERARRPRYWRHAAGAADG